jgi:hypothetical protein
MGKERNFVFMYDKILKTAAQWSWPLTLSSFKVTNAWSLVSAR